MLETVGDVGFVMAGVGMLVLGVLFLTCVRWWTDLLGAIIAAAFGAISLIMSLAAIRLVGLPLPGLFWWRAILFNVLGVVFWAGAAGFIWAQFIAPRVRRRVPSTETPDERKDQ